MKSFLMKPLLRFSLLAVLVALSIPSFAQKAPASARGQLLYDTHCVTCHNEQVHWRKQKAATDWASLKLQVRRWAESDKLGWSEADVAEVARYLNDTVYRFPQTSNRLSQAAP